MHTVGPIERFMTDDHARLDALLEASRTAAGTFEPELYTQFRHDLLRHIGMEEKVLFRYAQAKRAGVPLPLVARLHEDHGRIAKLLVPSPNAEVVAALKQILAQHNTLEEGLGALYAECDALAGEQAVDVIARLNAQPRVPLAKHYDGPAHPRR